jgi:hypothetical protein
MPYDLANFSISDMLRCGRELRRAAEHTTSMESFASAVVEYLYDRLRAPDGARACAMVRFYKTHPFGELDPSLQRFAARLLGARKPEPEMKCLTLLASTGDEPEWRDRHRSRGHQAIPLPSADIVEQAPMVAQLIKSLGMEIADVVSPDPSFVRSREGKSHGVFHVEHALGSPYIPAQAEFVERYGIRSVVGFGGLLRSGDLFAVIFFSRIPVDEGAAHRFRNVALDMRYGLWAHTPEQVFAAHAAR